MKVEKSAGGNARLSSACAPAAGGACGAAVVSDEACAAGPDSAAPVSENDRRSVTLNPGFFSDSDMWEGYAARPMISRCGRRGRRSVGTCWTRVRVQDFVGRPQLASGIRQRLQELVVVLARDEAALDVAFDDAAIKQEGIRGFFIASHCRECLASAAAQVKDADFTEARATMGPT